MKIKTVIFWILALTLVLTGCGIAEDELSTAMSEPQANMTSVAQAEVEEEAAEERMEFEADVESADDGLSLSQASGAPPPPALAIQATPPVPASAPNEPPADMSFQNPGTNPFLDTADDNLSTFALDVDTASYTVARNYLLSRSLLPPADAIRPEEFVNYFDAGYDSPGGDDAFAIYLDAAPAPFGFEDHQLLRVGIQGRYVAPEDRDPVFLVFVIDVSGSMDMENRLGLVKESLALLLDELREDDRVGIVVYSDNSRAVLQPTPASERATIDTAIDALRPEGSTNVQAGLQIGYAMATENMREGENTRVVVLSDGVANVGITEGSDMLDTIERSVEQGVTLSTIGFGMGNYNDVLMEELANNGNGNYYYVDEIKAARRVFVHNLTGTLQVIGYDAKIQVDFNTDVTDRYRLIGYENRAIADEDFRNDEVDAGEVGAGQSVTALYELAYEDGEAGQRVAADDVIATVYVRYEDAETREVVEISRSIRVEDVLADIEDAPASFRLHAAVAEFAELLRGSFWAEDGTYGDVLRLAQSAQADLNGDVTLTEDVDEFVAMVRSAIRAGDQ